MDSNGEEHERFMREALAEVLGSRLLLCLVKAWSAHWH